MKYRDERKDLEDSEPKLKKAATAHAGRKPKKDETQPLKMKKEEPEAPKPKKEEAPREKGDMRANTEYDKNHSGDIEIEEISSDSRCITLANHGQYDMNLEGWKIVRNLDAGTRTNEFEFPANASIKAGSQLKVNSHCLIIDEFL